MQARERVSIVTGAAGGIGAAVARTLSAEGAAVAVVDRHAAGLDRLVGELEAAGATTRAYPVDVRDAEGVETVVKRVEHELGPVNVLANVAGVLRAGPALTLTEDDWTTVFAVNTFGVVHFCQSVARRMVERGGGSIVTVGSNVTGVPRMQLAAYASSKAATAMFTKCLGLELARYNVRCNVVAPGSTDTQMQRDLWGDEAFATAAIAGSPEAFRTGIPLGRLADPADIADAVAFLASDRARHITMQDLYVDGGASLRA